MKRVKFVPRARRGVAKAAKVAKPPLPTSSGAWGAAKVDVVGARDPVEGSYAKDAAAASADSDSDDNLVPLEHHSRNVDNAPVSTHWTQKPLETLTTRDWRIAMEDFEIRSSSVVHPLRSWQESSLDARVVKQIAQQFSTPTAIQRGAIPPAMEGRDLLCLAPTGSGKSLAFCLPLVTKLLGSGERDTPRALVLAPTRELAVQIENQITKLQTGLRTCCIIGGRSYQGAMDKISAGVDVVVGTPGRLLDTVEQGVLAIGACDMLVIDEADQMITMGFQQQLEQVLRELPQPPQRQTLMFSATMPASVEDLTATYLLRPVRIQVGEVNKVVDTIRQVTIRVPREEAKFEFLVKELSRGGGKTIVFVNLQGACEELSARLGARGIASVTLHGGKSQQMREEAISAFRDKCNVLVATDVAGRGIDLDVHTVVNFHAPKNDDQYTHRVGRTGRAGRSGLAINFALDN